jgi:hypothetical protein
MSEHLHQASLFVWARHPLVRKKYPDLDLLFATLNGVHLGKAQAGKAKAAGLLAGVYDVFLPVRRSEYVGLIVEMKFDKGRLSDEQKWFGARMQENGWIAATCWSWTDARDVIVQYLESEKKK